MNKAQLPLSEKAFVLFIFSLLLFTVGISFYYDSAFNHLDDSQIDHEMIAICIDGEVACPGTLLIKKGSTLFDALKIAKVKANASLTNLKLDKQLAQGEMFYITKRGEKAIYLKGSVKKEGFITVPDDYRIYDLKSTQYLLDDVSSKWLKRKRLLKNQEVVIVPGTNEVSP